MYDPNAMLFLYPSKKIKLTEVNIGPFSDQNENWDEKETFATESEIDDPNLMTNVELTYSQKNRKQSLEIDQGRKGIEGFQPRSYSHTCYRKYMYMITPSKRTVPTAYSQYTACKCICAIHIIYD